MCQKTGDSRPHIFQHGQKTRCLVQICFPMANFFGTVSVQQFTVKSVGKHPLTQFYLYIVQFMGNSCYRKKKKCPAKPTRRKQQQKKGQGGLKLHHGPESHITRFAGLTTCGILHPNHTSACFHPCCQNC